MWAFPISVPSPSHPPKVVQAEIWSSWDTHPSQVEPPNGGGAHRFASSVWNKPEAGKFSAHLTGQQKGGRTGQAPSSRLPAQGLSTAFLQDGIPGERPGLQGLRCPGGVRGGAPLTAAPSCSAPGCGQSVGHPAAFPCAQNHGPLDPADGLPCHHRGHQDRGHFPAALPP